MEVSDVKEILREASVEVNAGGNRTLNAVFDSDFERVAIKIIEKLKKENQLK